MSNREVGEMMRRARLEAGLRQSDLAELMHTSRSSIARVEAGQYMPQLTTIIKWAELTGKRMELRLV